MQQSCKIFHKSETAVRSKKLFEPCRHDNHSLLFSSVVTMLRNVFTLFTRFYPFSDVKIVGMIYLDINVCIDIMSI